jgi:hypothetical protein
MEKLEASTAVADSRNELAFTQCSQPCETCAWDLGTFGLLTAARCCVQSLRVVNSQTSVSQRVRPALTEVAERPSAGTNAIEPASRNTMTLVDIEVGKP